MRAMVFTFAIFAARYLHREWMRKASGFDTAELKLAKPQQLE